MILTSSFHLHRADPAHPPCDIQSSLNFGLYGAQQVCSHLLQQLSEQDKQPILKIFLVDLDEVYQSLQEHAEHLNTHHM